MYHKKKQEFRAQFERTITSNTRHQGFKSNSSVIYFVFIFSMILSTRNEGKREHVGLT